MSGNPDFFPIERNRYFYGKLLSTRDFELEQQYGRKKAQLVNRLTLGAGVVCGLGVSASDESTLLIESGVALDYQGRLVVVEEPVLRKLQMIDGQDTLPGQESAYLCLGYQETPLEPVNAVGMDAGENRQFNLIREESRLFLTAQPPELRGLLEASGAEQVCILYTSRELTLALSAPEAVCGGEELRAEVLIVKNESTPPVQFRLEGEGAFVDSADGRILLEFQESPEEKRRVYTVQFPLKARKLSDLDSPLFPKGGELDLELGGRRYKNYIEIDLNCHLCPDRKALLHRREVTDNLELRLRGKDLPIYLAKLELINSSGGVFIASVTNLPFRQKLERQKEIPARGGLQTVRTTVHSMEYWQKPDVKAAYQSLNGELHLDFGIPSPEQYDYAVSHGTVELTLPGGLRVNSRVFSEEIPHGLGAGAVDVRLSVEYLERGTETTLLFGNSEVFRGKNRPGSPPAVETAALVYPERGTMRVGVWLHDMVEGSRLTIHYFAQKPERDANRLLFQRKVSLKLEPEFARTSRRGTVRIQAEVTGGEDRGVIWKVQEENGGVIDRNGIYQAPELPGTYEVVATARADESVTASAFIVVE